MTQPTFRVRIAALVQKSRKALRLYSTVGRRGGGRGSEFTEQQLQEWKTVNAELIRELTDALDGANPRYLVQKAFELRDDFNNRWRMVEAELRQKQRELSSACSSDDFTKAAVLSADLVILKARMQALQAGHHELDEALRKGRVSQPPMELSVDDVVDNTPQEERAPQSEHAAKVIPLRKLSSL